MERNSTVNEKAAIFGAGAALGVAAVSDRKAVVFGAGAAVGAAALYLASRRPAPTPPLPVFPANPTAGPLIYMDYNATTPIDPRVAAAMVPYLGEQGWGNPSSSHALGKCAKDAVTKARAQVAALIDADSPDELVFLSGGTESINWCLGAAMRAARAAAAAASAAAAEEGGFGGGGGAGGRRPKPPPHLITAHTEHVAVLETAAALEAEGFAVTYLPVDADGRVTAAQVAAAMTAETAVVSLMLANNETGSLHPVADVVAAVRAREQELLGGGSGASAGTGKGGVAGNSRRPPRVLIHTDASQALGKIPVSVRALGVDYLTVAGHKLYCSKGVGALYIRKHDALLLPGGGGGGGGARPPPPPLPKLMHGAGHEAGQRAGTENVLLNVGLGAACELARLELGAGMAAAAALRDRLQATLLARFGAADPAAARVNGHPTERLPNTLNVSFRGVRASRVLGRMAHRVAASAASACHAEDGSSASSSTAGGAGGAGGGNQQVYVSYVLVAMGVPVEWGAGTLRLTVGRFSTEAEVDEVAAIVIGAVAAESAASVGTLVTGGAGYCAPWQRAGQQRVPS
jgi:cysteine desulfurase